MASSWRASARSWSEGRARLAGRPATSPSPSHRPRATRRPWLGGGESNGRAGSEAAGKRQRHEVRGAEAGRGGGGRLGVGPSFSEGERRAGAEKRAGGGRGVHGAKFERGRQVVDVDDAEAAGPGEAREGCPAHGRPREHGEMTVGTHVAADDQGGADDGEGQAGLAHELFGAAFGPTVVGTRMQRSVLVQGGRARIVRRAVDGADGGDEDEAAQGGAMPAHRLKQVPGVGDVDGCVGRPVAEGGVGRAVHDVVRSDQSRGPRVRFGQIAAEKLHADAGQVRAVVAVVADEGSDALAGGAEAVVEVVTDESGGADGEETGFAHGRRIRGGGRQA